MSIYDEEDPVAVDEDYTEIPEEGFQIVDHPDDPTDDPEVDLDEVADLTFEEDPEELDLGGEDEGDSF